MPSENDFSKYTVRPFSGARYEQNERKVQDGFTPCVICGKGIGNGTEKHMAVVVDGGGAWGDESSDESAPGYMGCFPVGNDCHRKYAAR